VGANVHLANADRMNPQDVPVRDGLFQFIVVLPKPLTEATPPISPPPHLQEVVWSRKQEEKVE
jgi:hypothetical protein